MRFMCHREGCFEYVDGHARVCQRCALQEDALCEKSGCWKQAKFDSDYCDRHSEPGKVKHANRWRTLEECAERIKKRPEMRGVTWALQTQSKTVPVKGVDEKGRTVDTGGLQMLERTAWVGTLGTFTALVWAESEWRKVGVS